MGTKRGCRGWWIALPVFAADQLSKRAAAAVDGCRTLIPGILRCHRVSNTGMAFSMLSGHGWLLAGLTAAMIAGIALYLFRHPDEPALTRAGLWLIAGGGAGNLADRLTRGAVIDFLELAFVRFAVFNVADVCICLGAALVVAGEWRKERKKNQE